MDSEPEKSWIERRVNAMRSKKFNRLEDMQRYYLYAVTVNGLYYLVYASSELLNFLPITENDVKSALAVGNMRTYMSVLDFFMARGRTRTVRPGIPLYTKLIRSVNDGVLCSDANSENIIQTIFGHFGYEVTGIHEGRIQYAERSDAN